MLIQIFSILGLIKICYLNYHLSVVMDNASFHKRLDIQQNIREDGHILLTTLIRHNLIPFNINGHKLKLFENKNIILFLNFSLSIIFNHFILVWLYSTVS